MDSNGFQAVWCSPCQERRTANLSVRLSATWSFYGQHVSCPENHRINRTLAQYEGRGNLVLSPQLKHIHFTFLYILLLISNPMNPVASLQEGAEGHDLLEFWRCGSQGDAKSDPFLPSSKINLLGFKSTWQVTRRKHRSLKFQHWNMLKHVETCWNILKHVETGQFALQFSFRFWDSGPDGLRISGVRSRLPSPESS